MKNIKSIISVVTLTIVLSTSALAGDIPGWRTNTSATVNSQQSLIVRIGVAIKGDIPGWLVGIISVR